jgi:hypothetical protein
MIKHRDRLIWRKTNMVPFQHTFLVSLDYSCYIVAAIDTALTALLLAIYFLALNDVAQDDHVLQRFRYWIICDRCLAVLTSASAVLGACYGSRLLLLPYLCYVPLQIGVNYVFSSLMPNDRSKEIIGISIGVFFMANVQFYEFLAVICVYVRMLVQEEEQHEAGIKKKTRRRGKGTLMDYGL